MVAQPTNTEASTFYVANSETGTSYVVNAEVSTPYMVIIDQVPNIESSSSYMFTAEASTSGAVNAEFSTFDTVNVQPNSSYTIDTETNALCENAVYDEAITEEVNSIGKMQHDFSLLKLGYTFPLWDDVEAFFKAYGKYVPKKSIDINAHRNQQSKLTTFVNTHNHKLDPEKCKYNTKFRSIGDEALNDIEFYTKNGNLSITIQHQLLRAKYPDATFLDMDLANAIQHYKVKAKDLKNNAL
ncbi:11914_t:CDS:2 [Gigaspora margarita]|uniref:11914_t:CDS:1 n=1 Tax=Gigaspora margarita TaxID=4874 RepID=A0ABN7UX97_GIGMA|nr:11914_t:CDS:2 [Gigaspora margarita]